MKPEMIDRKEITVRFSEVDSMKIVWHGNYVKYFEDGRESFGENFNLGYLDVYKHQVMIPIVKINCNYIKPLVYGDSAIIETRFIDSDAAKIQFEYKIFRKSDQELLASGSSMQVFLTPEGELLHTAPEFFIGWKKKWGLIR